MMQINHRKLTGELLPVLLRRQNLSALLSVLNSGLVNVFNRFRAFYDEQLYKVNANASVISLAHHVSREFDVICRIDELDGEPYDFNVIVGGDVDEPRLIALIDRYKVSGKSYRVQTNRQYLYQWDRYECERIRVGYKVDWTAWWCERLYNVIINVSARVIYTSLYTRLRITLTASQPITVSPYFYVAYDVTGGWGSIANGTVTIRGQEFVQMRAGSTIVETEVVFDQANTNFEVDGDAILNAWLGNSFQNYKFSFTYKNE